MQNLIKCKTNSWNQQINSTGEIRNENYQENERKNDLIWVECNYGKFAQRFMLFISIEMNVRP